jgi:hypothetical protein
MTNLLSQAALLLNKTYRLLSTGNLPSSQVKLDPRTPPKTPFLLDLPYELITMVFKDEVLTNDDLASLRLTCKHTKYFASDILSRRHFVNMDVLYSEYATKWFASFLLSDLSSHLRSLSLIRLDESYYVKTYPSRHHTLPKGNAKPDYSQLQDLIVTGCDGAIGPWKMAFCGASHLKVFKVQISARIGTGVHVPHWVRVKRHRFDHNDELLRSINSDCLTEVTLVGMHLSASGLKQLLGHHSDTLSSVEIRCCWLVDRKWLEILDWIRSNLLKLRSLHVDVSHEAVNQYRRHNTGTSRVHQYRGEVSYTILTLENPIKLKLEGREAIDDGILELLNAYDWQTVVPSRQLIRFWA